MFGLDLPLRQESSTFIQNVTTKEPYHIILNTYCQECIPMLNYNQTVIVLVIGLVAVLMTLASTRVFAQPTLPPSQIEQIPNEENKVNNALQGERTK